MSVEIAPRSVTRALLLAVLFLVLAHVAGYSDRLGHTHPDPLVLEFDLDRENSVPSWFSSTLLFVASMVLALTGSLKKAAHDADARYWSGLAVVFLFLSLDESASLHELTIMPLRQRLGAGGFLYSTWIVPAAAFVAVLGLVYLRFLARLPARTRRLVAASAVIYLSGTLGLEAVSGRHEDLHGWKNVTYAMLVTAEETLEMLGIVLFIHALLTHVAAEGEDVRLRFGERGRG